jgi:hypothetical protein
MRAILLSCAATVLLAHPALADPAGGGLSAKAEACIRSEAPVVSRMTATLTDAVNFLISDLCGVEVSRAENFEANSRTVSQLQATMPAPALAGVSVDPNTGDLKYPPGFSPPIGSTSALLSMRSFTPRPKFAAIAARAVLTAKSASHS